MTSSYEAARAAGITYRQLDAWVRIGAIAPSGAAQGQGSRRRWADLDVDRLIVLGRLARLLGEMDRVLARALWAWLGVHRTWPGELAVGRDQHGHWRVGDAGVAQAGLWVACTGTSRALAARAGEMDGQMTFVGPPV